MELIQAALNKKYPKATFTYHINDVNEVIVDSWSDTDGAAKPTSAEIAIIVNEYKLGINKSLMSFDTNRLLAVLNAALSQATVFKLAAHTGNLIGYCNAKNFWGDKSASSYITLMEDNNVATPEEMAIIKQAFLDQNIELDNPYTELT